MTEPIPSNLHSDLPADENADLASVLLTEQMIAARVAELGLQISREYQGKPLVLVGVLKGSVVFLADLSRQLKIPHEIGFVGAQSYKNSTSPSARVNITKEIDIDLKDRDVLMVEDIIDTGSTLHVLLDMIRMYQPRSLEICTLLFKKKQREKELPIKYIGFQIEDSFVVGYGLDYKERYRYLRCVGVLNPDLCQGK